MYYCEAHKIAYTGANQWVGHWLSQHRGESRPKAEDANVEQVPEGTTLAPPPAPKHLPRSTPPLDPDPARPHIPSVPLATPTYVDEEEAHLDQLLDSIGVPQAQRQTIVKGWRNFPVLHQHPGNLDNHIMGIVGPKFRGSVQLVVHAMFPGAEQEAPASQYMYGYGPPRYDRRPPTYWPEDRGWERDPAPYRYAPFPRQGQMGAENPEASPQVIALQKQVSGILEAFEDERTERARERQEQREKDRDAALQAQINTLAGKVDSTFKEFGDLVKGIGEQLQRGRGDVELSHTQQLVERVNTLTETIASQREAHLQGTVDALRGELGEVRQKLNTEPTGLTTEDLISKGLPVIGARLEEFGAGIKDEMRGIRVQMGEGKLPALTPPALPNSKTPPGSTDPVEAAHQIAGARAVEDRILALVGR